MDLFLDDLTLNAGGPISLREQLLMALRERILDGRLHAGTKMPPSRALAQHLGIGRNTVIDVYETLQADGMIASQQGRGTFVSERVSAAPSSVPEQDVTLSNRAHDLLQNASSWSLARADKVLEPGISAMDRFPHEQWRRCLSKAVAAAGPYALWTGDARGTPALRSIIAAHIGPSRSVACHADQVVLFSSQRLALHVLLALLLDPGAPVLIEDPCLQEVRAVVKAQGLRPVPLPVTEAGADISRLSPEARAARLAIVTPSHQYPTGVGMRSPQRDALLDWAETENAYIFEDDYDGEFWLSEDRSTALFSSAPSDRVLYFNSFSKTMFPALRISYLVLPEALVGPVTAMKSLLEPQVSMVAELALTEFILSGAYTRHLRDMRQVYRERHAALHYALEQKLGDRVRIAPRQYGLHLCAELDRRFCDREVAAGMRDQGYGCTPLSGYYMSGAAGGAEVGNGLVMGYAGWDVSQLTRSVDVLQSLCR